jgi:hypothetical protein
MIVGLNKRLAGQTLTVNSVQVAFNDAIAVLQGVETARRDTASARAAWIALAKANAAKIAAGNALMVGLHTTLRYLYGDSSETLVDFGMKPKAVRARTGAAMAATAQKAQATRQARHTMGPRQKAAIHGALPAPPGASSGTGTTTK